MIVGFLKAICNEFYTEFGTDPGNRWTIARLERNNFTFRNFSYAPYATDVTFQLPYRPSGTHEESKKYFSGKHKHYGFKTEVSTSQEKVCLVHPRACIKAPQWATSAGGWIFLSCCLVWSYNNRYILAECVFHGPLRLLNISEVRHATIYCLGCVWVQLICTFVGILFVIMICRWLTATKLVSTRLARSVPENAKGLKNVVARDVVREWTFSCALVLDLLPVCKHLNCEMTKFKILLLVFVQVNLNQNLRFWENDQMFSLIERLRKSKSR